MIVFFMFRRPLSHPHLQNMFGLLLSLLLIVLPPPSPPLSPHPYATSSPLLLYSVISHVGHMEHHIT